MLADPTKAFLVVLDTRWCDGASDPYRPLRHPLLAQPPAAYGFLADTQRQGIKLDQYFTRCRQAPLRQFPPPIPSTDPPKDA